MNYGAIGISAVCLVILLIFEFKVKSLIGKKCRFPVPVQFILVFVGTLVAWSLHLNEDYDVKVVGNVPTG